MPMTENCGHGKQSVMYGPENLPVTISTFLLVYRVVSASYVSLPQLKLCQQLPNLPPLPPATGGTILHMTKYRMLLKTGYRYVYVSRKFAMRHGFIPQDAAPGHYGYSGLVK